MARAKRKRAGKKKADAVAEAAVEYFAARSHDAWRRTLLKTNPEQKGKLRLRRRGGVMVDVNQPWSKLHAKAKADNKRAAFDAYDAVTKFPHDREAAADYVHKCWIKRNKNDPSQPKALFKPYARLTEVEKDKDRAHVDTMKKAIAAVRKRTAPGKPRTIALTPEQWARLDAAAKALSAHLGRPVAAEALLIAGVEAIAAVSGAIAKPKKTRRRRATA